ncbi:histone-lysine N-methyltransferase SETMAR-like [Parasteatoda tepidariorum]|uniref:histone-lysine N-methyltransferase SETMAR-like n=1 Tax=Parasteatoda tepidariorum TaxID=114398 RepID=UPI0039BD7344
MELTREHFHALIFYDFIAGLNQEECVQLLQLAFGDESPARATVFRWFKEFSRDGNFLQDEENTGRPPSAVIPDNVSVIRKMLKDDNRCTYQIIQKELNIGSAAIHKIIHKELRMKKVVCHWVPHNLTEHQKEERVRIGKETLKLQNNGGHRIISKIVKVDETNIPFFDVPTRQKSKVWVFEDDLMPTVVKRQRALKEVPLSSEEWDWSKPSNWKDRRQ